jgi:hypothetical protein
MAKSTVLLREKGSKHSQPFEADHAKRLLAYHKTQWEEVAEHEAPKGEAAAGKKKPAAAADSTGMPTEV